MREWNIPPDEAFLKSYTGSMTQLAGLKRYIFSEGKAAGVEAVDINSGNIALTVLPGRGMDIAWASYKGMPLSYMSKTGVVSPAYYESGGMNWLRNFSAGLLTTCGLQNVGEPCNEDVPVIGDTHFGLHGRISNCAAENISLYEEWENGKYVMSVSGKMREAVLHGEHLTLRRNVTAILGENRFRIVDRVKNEGCTAQPLTLLYHFNIGYPLLSAASRFSAVSNAISGFSPAADAEIGQYDKCHEPLAGIEERCYSHDLNADENGIVSAALINGELEMGVYIAFDKEVLPCFTQWKMLRESEYVMGLEPGNCLPKGRTTLRNEGALPFIKQGETKEFSLTFGVLDGLEEIHKYETDRGSAFA